MSTLARNLLIKASAGTGKTFALATRFIQLMVYGAVSPDHILALTFSRAAAQEIYTKLLERLWNASMSNEAAKEEVNLICENGRLAPPRGFNFTASEFRAILEKVIDSQQAGSIATLDSFILRLVSNYPRELGFQNSVDILGEYEENDAVTRARDEILDSMENGDGDMAFRKYVRMVCGDEYPRSYRGKLESRAAVRWSRFVANLRDKSVSVDEKTMCEVLGIAEVKSFAEEAPRVAEFAVDNPKAKATDKEGVLSIFLKQCNEFKEENSLGHLNGGKSIATLRDLYVQGCKLDRLDYELRGKPVIVEFTVEEEKAIRSDLDRMVALYFRAKIRKSAAALAIAKFIDERYHRNTRRAGHLTFDDLAKIRETFKRDGHRDVIENIEYRFDAKFEHWALDEFQDTSVMQWACLKDLVDNAAQNSDVGGGVVVVGDLKQSIYAWRGGNEGPFKEMMGWSAFLPAGGGEIRDFKTSYRYGKHICDFVNDVFGGENLSQDGRLAQTQSIKEGFAKWLLPESWMKHEPFVSHDGRVNDGDYVKVVAVPPMVNDDASSEGFAKGDDDIEELSKKSVRRFFPLLLADLEPFWKEHEDKRSNDTVAILVRSNDEGRELARVLSKKGFGVVWEGTNVICDVPIVRVVLALLRLSEHPDDKLSYGAVSHSRVLKVAAPILKDAFKSEDVSRAVSRLIATGGLTRTLKDITGAIVADVDEAGKPTLDAFSVVRLASLVKAAVDFESIARHDQGIDDFIEYVSGISNRELAQSARVIRILTIHRSKGLSIDHVFVPIFEGSNTKAIDDVGDAMLFGKGGGWAVAGVSKNMAVLNEHFRMALEKSRKQSVLDELHTWYVALTRSKKSLFVYASEKAKEKDEVTSIGKIVLAPYCESPKMSGGVVYEAGSLDVAYPTKSADDAKNVEKVDEWASGRLVGTVRRSTPSSVHPISGEGIPVENFFAADAGAGAKKGTEVHAKLEKIEWLDPAGDLTDEERALTEDSVGGIFVKADDVCGLWRERSYEICRDGVWESGQFDRVIFSERDGVRFATIIDFKTNSIREGESREAFAERLKKMYSAQLKAYRKALFILTDIPEARIKCQILPLCTNAVVDVA